MMAKKYLVKNSNVLVAKKSRNKLNYYLKTLGGEELYLFTREYSMTCYNLCKSGVPVQTVLLARTRNRALMNLSKYLRFMMPYLVEYYNLNVA